MKFEMQSVADSHLTLSHHHFSQASALHYHLSHSHNSLLNKLLMALTLQDKTLCLVTEDWIWMLLSMNMLTHTLGKVKQTNQI